MRYWITRPRFLTAQFLVNLANRIYPAEWQRIDNIRFYSREYLESTERCDDFLKYDEAFTKLMDEGGGVMIGDTANVGQEFVREELSEKESQ